MFSWAHPGVTLRITRCCSKTKWNKQKSQTAKHERRKVANVFQFFLLCWSSEDVSPLWSLGRSGPLSWWHLVLVFIIQPTKKGICFVYPWRWIATWLGKIFLRVPMKNVPKKPEAKGKCLALVATKLWSGTTKNHHESSAVADTSHSVTSPVTKAYHVITDIPLFLLENGDPVISREHPRGTGAYVLDVAACQALKTFVSLFTCMSQMLFWCKYSIENPVKWDRRYHFHNLRDKEGHWGTEGLPKATWQGREGQCLKPDL